MKTAEEIHKKILIEAGECDEKLYETWAELNPKVFEATIKAMEEYSMQFKDELKLREEQLQKLGKRVTELSQRFQEKIDKEEKYSHEIKLPSDEEIMKYFITEKNKQGEEKTMVPGQQSPHGFRKFAKAFKTGWMACKAQLQDSKQHGKIMGYPESKQVYYYKDTKQ